MIVIYMVLSGFLFLGFVFTLVLWGSMKDERDCYIKENKILKSKVKELNKKIDDLSPELYDTYVIYNKTKIGEFYIPVLARDEYSGNWEETNYFAVNFMTGDIICKNGGTKTYIKKLIEDKALEEKIKEVVGKKGKK